LASARTLSAGAVVVRPQHAAWRYLLLRAYRDWDFPKGHVERGETPLAAACREVREETGLSNLRFDWGEQFYETPPYGHNKVARFYLACTLQGEVCLAVNPQLGRPEHAEYRWLDYHAARGLLVPRLQAVIDWAHALVQASPCRVPESPKS
jgi:bis(5'-nucleosidyl)-tetraphosphatase